MRNETKQRLQEVAAGTAIVFVCVLLAIVLIGIVGMN
jgi:hypothetical protein